jgi:hypothetical protein
MTSSAGGAMHVNSPPTANLNGAGARVRTTTGAASMRGSRPRVARGSSRGATRTRFRTRTGRIGRTASPPSRSRRGRRARPPTRLISRFGTACSMTLRRGTSSALTRTRARMSSTACVPRSTTCLSGCSTALPARRTWPWATPSRATSARAVPPSSRSDCRASMC